MTQSIPINPKILKWARERAGYTIEQMVKYFPKLVTWEDEKAYPTFWQLEALAEKYKIPIAVFFFPSPPKELSIEKSLRAVSKEDIYNLAPQVRFLFRKGKAFQLYLKELMLDEQQKQLNKVQWLQKETHTSPSKLANHIRQILNIPINIQHEWENVDQALDEWRDLLANNGVYVFKDAFKDDGISGFCIYDDLFPIIFINNSLSKRRQIFTIFHELAHLIFKQNYLDVLNEDIAYENDDKSDIEVKCNAFAGDFLVPDDDFKNRYQHNASLESNISDLAELYKTSKEVILRKFLAHGIITKKTFILKMNEWTHQIKGHKRLDKSKAGGNYYLTKLQYLGNSYFSLVFSKYYQGKIDFDKAAVFLDIKPKSFSGLEETFLKREIS